MEDYREFRRRTIEELTREFPDKTYREKMRIVSNRWKQTKITQLVRLDQDQLVNGDINDIFIKKLRYTILDIGPEDFLDMECDEDGTNICMFLLAKCLKILPPKSRHLGVFSRFLGIKKFYKLMYGGLNVFDLCCMEIRRDFLFEVFTRMPPRWHEELILSRKKSLGSLMNIFLLNIFDEDMKGETLDLTCQLIMKGLDPNINLSSPINIHNPWIYRDNLMGYLTSTGSWETAKRAIRYSGAYDEEREYKDFLRKSEFNCQNSRLQQIDLMTRNLSMRFVGDTILSILLQNSRSHKLRSFVSKIFKSGVADVYVFLSPYKHRNEIGTCTYFSLSIVSGSMKHIDELSSIIYNLTPSFMFFVRDETKVGYANFNPIQLIYNSIKTPWNGYISTCSDTSQILNKILLSGFIVPSRDLFWKFHMQEGFMKKLQTQINEAFFYDPTLPIYKNVLRFCNINGRNVFETCISSVLMTREFLDKTIRIGLIPNTFEDMDYIHLVLDRLRDQFLERIKKICQDNEEYVNDCFLNCESTASSGKMVFKTVDNYGFEPSEWPFLLMKKENPYTRRTLSEEEVSRLRVLRDIVKTYWFLFTPDVLPQYDSMKEVVKTDDQLFEDYISKIDEFMDSIGMLNYEERLRNHREKFLDPERLRSFLYKVDATPINYLNPEIEMGIDVDMMDWCISMRPASIDPSDIEEIGIYYNISLGNLKRGSENIDMKHARALAMGYVYNILETTKVLGRQDRFTGRVLSVYFAMKHL